MPAGPQTPVADGADGKVQVLWDNTNGTLSLWSLDNTAAVLGEFLFGPSQRMDLGKCH